MRRTSLTATIVKITQVDTAVFYAGGTSEEYLGKIGWKERGLLIETKIYPTIVSIEYRIVSIQTE